MQLTDAAPELALGILPGDERAAALAHLDECPACQQQVASLAGVTDQLLLRAPKAQPPAGFEQRVLAALDGTSTISIQRARDKRRAIRASVGALALAACLALGVLLRWSGSSIPPTLAVEQMSTESGTVVGEAFVHRERPHVLFISLPGWKDQAESYGRPDDTYALRIERRDGPPQVLPVEMNADDAWATTLDFDPKAMTSVAMVDSQGRVWCRAQFGSVE